MLKFFWCHSFPRVLWETCIWWPLITRFLVQPYLHVQFPFRLIIKGLTAGALGCSCIKEDRSSFEITVWHFTCGKLTPLYEERFGVSINGSLKRISPLLPGVPNNHLSHTNSSGCLPYRVEHGGLYIFSRND